MIRHLCYGNLLQVPKQQPRICKHFQPIDISRCGLVLCRPPGHHASKNRSSGFCSLAQSEVGLRLRSWSSRCVVRVRWILGHSCFSALDFRNQILWNTFVPNPYYSYKWVDTESGSAIPNTTAPSLRSNLLQGPTQTDTS